jgi:GxxExxY protein
LVRTGEHIPLPPGTESIARKIVDSAYLVHKALGPGLLENVYEVCFCHELKKHGLSLQRQVSVPTRYDDIIFNEGLRLDVPVEGQVICELKTVESLNGVHQAQLLSQMKLTGKRLGFLINFNVAVIKYGIKRMILQNFVSLES